MRARLALRVSGIQVALREVDLSSKPPSLKAYSAKATVPVLVLEDEHVIDESLDIMLWALQQRDPGCWLLDNPAQQAETRALIYDNDQSFKTHLDHYKYAVRYPDQPMSFYREQGEQFLIDLEQRLADNRYLMCDRPSLADMAILPFIRQFAYVDIGWFEQSRYARLREWMFTLLSQSLFSGIMTKYTPWQEGDDEVWF